VRPQIFDQELTPAGRFNQRPKLHPRAESSRNIAVEFYRNFSAASLRLADSGQSDELARISLACCFRCAYSTISSVKCL
jgi:hypothetical protein